MVKALDQENIPFKLIHADENGVELGYLTNIEVDIEIGGNNDFELTIPACRWKELGINFKDRIFIPGTEFGGIATTITSNPKDKEVKVGGITWRGLLDKKVVEPPADSSNLILDGELNNVLRELIGQRFGSFFVIPEIDSGIMIRSWVVDRYVTLLSALDKLLDACYCKLSIKSIEGDNLYIEVTATESTDFSSEVEYEERTADLTVKDFKGGINHLVCIGKGQNEERTVLHLYVSNNGEISERQYYKGLDEIAGVYEYSSAELEELRKNGIKKLEELKNNKEVKITARDADFDIGDVISGYDAITNTSAKIPIAEKILKIDRNNKPKIEYKTRR